MVIEDRLAPHAFEVPSPCPGALCLSALHLPGHTPMLLISVYAQAPRGAELEKELNKLFPKYPMWIMGGDFNAQVTPLDTNGVTPSRWHWPTSLIEDKKEATDSFRAKHHDTIAFTRFRNNMLPSDTRIDLLLFSSSLVSLPSFALVEADICTFDRTSDHHPIFATFRPPYTPQYPPLLPHVLLVFAAFRKLSSKNFLISSTRYNVGPPASLGTRYNVLLSLP